MANRGVRSLVNANGTLPYTPVRSTSGSAWSSIHTIDLEQSTGSTAPSATPVKRIWRTATLRQGKIRMPRIYDVRAYITTHITTTSIFLKKFANWKDVRRFLLMTTGMLLVVLFVYSTPEYTTNTTPDVHRLSAFVPMRPALLDVNQTGPDPVRWLKENSNNKYAFSDTRFPHLPSMGGDRRPRAALISLVRNSELEGMMQSMRQLEYRWNRKYQYPWVFFNDEPFTDEFKAGTRNMTSAECYYKVVPKEHWSLPSSIDADRFENGLEYLGTIGVGKGWMVSYHHMCRWNSGFFYQHPFLQDYDWYWRVEPDVHYFCDIDYDVFRFMRDNDLQYGFNMNILDDARSFPSLWAKTQAFFAAHPHLLHPDADPSWLLSPTDGTYNNCQFFSNFEIGSLAFFRSPAYAAYFSHLDASGGFYYERFGDAPVHTLAVALLLPKRAVWWFRDVGYQHNIARHCPPGREGVCACEPTSVDQGFYQLVPERSGQRKPSDTCVRLWLGGEWLRKKEGWSVEVEREWGGDGYHGYEVW